MKSTTTKVLATPTTQQAEVVFGVNVPHCQVLALQRPMLPACLQAFTRVQKKAEFELEELDNVIIEIID